MYMLTIILITGYPFQCRWIPIKGRVVPRNAVVGGQELDGKPLYITKTNDDGHVIPGKFGNHLRGYCHFSLNGEEKRTEVYDILVMDKKYLGQIEWLVCKDGSAGPCEKNAIQVEDGVFIARVAYKGSITPGKLVRYM